jgi:hypothetical protein
MKREHYSAQNLTRAIVRDLISDIRCSETRDREMPGMLEYAAKCRRQVATVFRNRHGLKLDRYGWPSGILAD